MVVQHRLGLDLASRGKPRLRVDAEFQQGVPALAAVGVEIHQRLAVLLVGLVGFLLLVARRVRPDDVEAIAAQRQALEIGLETGVIVGLEDDFVADKAEGAITGAFEHLDGVMVLLLADRLVGHDQQEISMHCGAAQLRARLQVLEGALQGHVLQLAHRRRPGAGAETEQPGSDQSPLCHHVANLQPQQERVEPILNFRAVSTAAPARVLLAPVWRAPR